VICGVLVTHLICSSLHSNHSGLQRIDAVRATIDGVILFRLGYA